MKSLLRAVNKSFIFFNTFIHILYYICRIIHVKNDSSTRSWYSREVKGLPANLADRESLQNDSRQDIDGQHDQEDFEGRGEMILLALR